jgi:hypothetical protein
MPDYTQSRYQYVSFKGGSYRRYIQAEDKTSIGTHIHVPATTDAPAHGTYGALMFDARWRAKRAEIIARDNNCCVNCKEQLNLQVHHRQYHFVVRDNKFKLPWDYPGHLLITLCEPCHKKGHSKYKVPTIHI